MSEKAEDISIAIEIPAHLLEKLGSDPADKIRELLEKYIEEHSDRVKS